MPLFGSKFSPKKGVPRKWPSLSNLNLDEKKTDLGLDYGPIKIKLGENNIYFDNGQWITEGGGRDGGGQRQVQQLQHQNHQLQEENNLLKIKLDLLLDMLAQTTAEVHLQENEKEQLKKQLRKK